MAYQFSNDPLFVREGDIIQFQYKAPETWDTTETVTIQVGYLTQYWFITTLPEDFQPDPFPFQDIENAELDVVYTYGDGTRPGEQIITVSGLTPGTIVPVTLSANDFPDPDRYSASINGGPFGLITANTTVQNGDTIQIRAKTFNAPSQTLRITLNIGLGQEQWRLTTKQTPINSPNPAPIFTPISNLALSVPVYSNIVVVQGLTAPGQVSAGFGTLVAVSNNNNTITNEDGYDVLTGVTFSTTAIITNGQYLQLLGTSSANPNSTLPIAVDIGEAIGVSTWELKTGNAPSFTPNNFTFPNVTDVAPDVVIVSQPRPVGGITGLSPDIVVPVELISTTGIEPRIKINDGSVGVFPTTVTNGDIITLYNRSSPDFGGNVETLIKVGTRVITTWSIDTYLTPDSIPSFTPPSNLTNRVPGTYVSSAIIGLTDLNVPIIITATNGALISIDYDTPIAGPRTFDPAINTLIFISLLTSNELDTASSTTVTIGDATPFTWSVSTYAVAPPPPSNLSTWYSIKTKKYDGFTIGTVVQVLKENLVTEYGDLEDRFPGFLPCDGAAYPVAQYPELWNIIKNTYGGNGEFDIQTREYSGTFNVPDYRNKRMCGVGVVDGNAGGSSFLPVTSGTINEVGSTGGYWYIDRTGASGPLPLEQVFTGGTESNFFALGTVKTIGTENLISEVDFNVAGSVNAVLGALGETLVNVPIHEHTYWSASVDQETGEPVIPWGRRGMYGFTDLPSPDENRIIVDFTWTGGSTNIEAANGVYGPIEATTISGTGSGATFTIRRDGNGNVAGVELIDGGSQYQEGNTLSIAPSQFGEVLPGLSITITVTDIGTARSVRGRVTSGEEQEVNVQLFRSILSIAGGSPNALQEITATGLDLEQFVPYDTGRNGEVIQFGNYWASPLSELTARAGGRLYDTGGNASNYAGVIDTRASSMRIDAYASPGVLKTHSHNMSLDNPTNPQTDFTYGNTIGPGIKYAGSLPTSNQTLEVTFDQSQVGLELSPATFTFNSSIKPIPVVNLAPTKTVPLAAPFHKVKYIIKAY